MSHHQTNHPCEEFGPLLSGQIDNELGFDELQYLNEHVENCAFCFATRESLKQVNQLVHDAFDSRIANSPVPRIASAPKVVLAADCANIGKPGRKLTSMRKTVWRLVALGSAAILLVALMSTDWPLSQSPANQPLAEPLVEVHLINEQNRCDQQLMLKTMEWELRTLKLELMAFDSSRADPMATRIEELMEKVKTAGEFN